MRTVADADEATSVVIALLDDAQKRAAALEVALRAYHESVPRCQRIIRLDEELPLATFCMRPATHRDLNFAECDLSYWCDEHKTMAGIWGPGSDEVPWADAAREAAKLLQESEKR